MATDEEDLQQYLDTLSKDIEEISDEALEALRKVSDNEDDNTGTEAIEVEDEYGTYYINYYFQSKDKDNNKKSPVKASKSTAVADDKRKNIPKVTTTKSPSSNSNTSRKDRHKSIASITAEQSDDIVFIMDEYEDIVPHAPTTMSPSQDPVEDEDTTNDKNLDDLKEIYEFDENDDDDDDIDDCEEGNNNKKLRHHMPSTVVSLKDSKSFSRKPTDCTGASESHQCRNCDYETSKKHLLQRHLKIHSKYRPFTCSVCERGFRANSSLQNHMNLHLGKKPHCCQQCSKCFTTAGELVRHTRYKHTGEKPHKCNECDYSSVELSKLRRHMRCHTGERPYQCPHCTYASPDTFKLKRHLRTHTGEKPYECDICHARFTQSNSMKAHRLIHSVGDKPIFQCPLCPTTCGRKSDLRMHIQKLHTSEQMLVCKKCGKELPDRYSYKMHVKTHEGEKCYRCEVCPYASISMHHLETHMLIHTDEKPFICEICNMAFRQRQLLKRHTNHYHNKDYVPPSPRDKTHNCPHCKRSFTHKGNLLRHMEVHDPDCDRQEKRLQLKLGRNSKIESNSSELKGKLNPKRNAKIANAEKDKKQPDEFLLQDDENLASDDEDEYLVQAALRSKKPVKQLNKKTREISIKIDPDEGEIITGDLNNEQYMVVEVVECNEDENEDEDDEADMITGDEADYEEKTIKGLTLAPSKETVRKCFGFQDEDNSDNKGTIQMLRIMDDI